MKTKILHYPENGVLEIIATGELCNDKACDLMQITLGHITSSLAFRLVIDLRATRLNHGFSLFNLYRLVENFRQATVCRDVQILILSRGEEKKRRYLERAAGQAGIDLQNFSSRADIREWLGGQSSFEGIR
ncbi:hypothetical protein [uncultured Desulfobulbus sp.]|uniref:hypothetical protein n=1 Tax=uncultured Desulfobulbus sp. TaxID=239745 RepID=UPI0029C7C9E1|nr:hypothetical protein [uncultured Desulfobulbus sp.]